MTDEYQNAVKKLVDYIGDTVAFAKDQLPDVAKEILVYNASVDHFWLVIWGVAAVISLLLIVVGILTDTDGMAPIMSFAFLVFIVLSGFCYMDLVKIQEAPKLYILDELKSRIPHPSCPK